MEDLKTPARTAVAATTAYTPGWMFQDSGSHIMRFSPTMPPKEDPTCTHANLSMPGYSFQALGCN